MKPFIAYVFVVFSIVCFCVPAWPADAEYTLKHSVEIGLDANPGVESKRKLLEQSQLNINAARGYFLPSFTLQSSISSYSQTGDVISTDELDQHAFTNGFKISQPLFSGFAILSNYLKSKLQADMERAKLDQARLDLIINIQKTFLQLLKSREDLTTVDNEIVRLKAQLDASQVFFKAGIDPYNDVLKSEVELAKAEGDKVKVLNSIKNLTTQLNTFLAIEHNKSIDYQGSLQSYNSLIPFSEESAIQEALAKRPDIIIAQKSIEIAQKESEGTFAQYMPKISLDYSKTDQDTDYKNYIYDEVHKNYETIGVSATWKIFDGGTTTYTYLGERKRSESLKKSYEEQLAKMKEGIIKSFTDIEDAKKLIEISKKTKTSASENYNMAAARYRTRIGTITDLLDAQYQLTRAESEMSNAYMQYHIARSTLFYNVGIENAGLE